LTKKLCSTICNR